MGAQVSRLPRREPADGDLAALLARIGVGDQIALADFYRATSPRVFGLAMKILRDRLSAEETTLEVYTQIWQQPQSYSRARSSVLGWLLLVTRSRAIDSLRRSERPRNRADIDELALELRSADRGPVETSSAAECANLVRDAVAKLPRGQREAIAAAYFGGYSHNEAAEALQVPLGTLKSRIRAGMAQLRRTLSESDEVMA